MKSSFEWERRIYCPCCFSSRRKTKFSMKFSEPKVFNFIEKYYGGKIKKEFFGNTRFTIFSCSNCSLVYQENILTDQSAELFYEEYISKKASLNKRTDATLDYYIKLNKSVSNLLNFKLNETANKIKVLDFGMGWGHWVRAASAHGIDAFGAELSKARISYAKSMGVRIIDINSKEWFSSFDFINTDQVFEHVSHPPDILKKLKKLMKPRGIIKIFVPNGNYDSIRLNINRFQVGKNSLHPIEHINSFNRRALFSMMKNHGFIPIKILDKRVANSLIRNIFGFPLRRPSWYFELND